MRNLMKLLGIIALVAVIGFVVVSCDNGTTTSTGSTPRPGTEPPPPPTPPVDTAYVTHTNHAWGPWGVYKELNPGPDYSGWEARECKTDGESHFVFRELYPIGQGPIIYELSEDGKSFSVRWNGSYAEEEDINLIIPEWKHTGATYAAGNVSGNAAGTTDYQKANYLPVVRVLGFGDSIWNDTKNLGNGDINKKGDDTPASSAVDRFSLFAGRVQIVSVKFLGNNLKSIGAGAFAGTGIAGELELPSSLETIGVETYMDFDAMEALRIAGNPVSEAIIVGGASATALTGGASPNSVSGNGGTNGVGGGAIGIPGAFMGTLITKVTIPTSVKLIGDNTFKGCNALETVVFDNWANSTLERIGWGAFEDTTGLKGLTVNLPARVKFIGARAFAGATSLSNITIPSGVEYIVQNAFAGWGAGQEIILTGVADRAAADNKWNKNYVIARPELYGPGAGSWGPSFWDEFPGASLLTTDWSGGAASVAFRN